MSALSKRLQAVLDFCHTLHTPEMFTSLADIGTDHAYLPIAAINKNICKYAYACDVHEGPAMLAAENIRNAGLCDKIEVRLANSLAAINTAQCIVIAGMGGMRIWEIIYSGLSKAKAAKRLVLQPQHDAMLLRKSLHGAGFEIQDECMVREVVGHKEHFYVIIAAEYRGETLPWTMQEYYLGKYLLACNNDVFQAYKQHERDKINAYISNIRDDDAQRNANKRLGWLE